jgi:hypothetical protein
MSERANKLMSERGNVRTSERANERMSERTTDYQRPPDRFRLAYHLNQRPKKWYQDYYPEPFVFNQKPTSDILNPTSDDRRQLINNPGPKTNNKRETIDDRRTTTNLNDKDELKMYMITQHDILEDLDENGLRKQEPFVEEVRRI